jgi:hypothetical protein
VIVHNHNRTSAMAASLTTRVREADKDHRLVAHGAALECDFDAMAARPPAERGGYLLMRPAGEVLNPKELPGAFDVMAG